LEGEVEGTTHTDNQDEAGEGGAVALPPPAAAGKAVVQFPAVIMSTPLGESARVQDSPSATPP
jgi:hypothetical protein